MGSDGVEELDGNRVESESGITVSSGRDGLFVVDLIKKKHEIMSRRISPAVGKRRGRKRTELRRTDSPDQIHRQTVPALYIPAPKPNDLLEEKLGRFP